ncbi:MAG TPA: hypothetical protein VEF76_15090 [Patescibacteria group bacterium]|nr:hypothetical protein [Patescibacteria group bacterium]
MTDSITLLPAKILDRASLSGNEYAWPINDIPDVIEAVRKENLISIGGQLQFRIPDRFGGGTCECYWVEVDTCKSVSDNMPWHDRVNETADTALLDFENLKTKYNFLEEGRKAFGKYLDEAEELGADIQELMCFVWYTNSEEEYNRLSDSKTNAH